MDDIKDTIMIGAGPSALAAAIYTTREDIDTTLYEKAVVGGLAAITDVVDNYPGFPDGIEGMKLADQLQKQAERFGTKIEYGQVDALRNETDYRIVTVDGKEIKAKTVLIATGSDYNKINVPGEAEYYGRGVHYCATCDGAFYRDKKLAVVGGGNSAVQEAIFLTRFASHIDLLVRSDIKASDVLVRELQKYIDEGKVTVHLNTTTEAILANESGMVNRVRVIKDGTSEELSVDGVFVFVGLKPNTQFLAGSGVELDERGLIKTDHKLETNLTGVFASGDVRSGATMQIASAVGEGATAALSIREFLDELARS
jgi:thioredoxin reductase (NADPH)